MPKRNLVIMNPALNGQFCGSDQNTVLRYSVLSMRKNCLKRIFFQVLSDSVFTGFTVFFFLVLFFLQTMNETIKKY